MIVRSYPQTTGQQVERGWRFGWIDAIVILAVFALLWLLVVLSGDMRVRFDELHPPPLSLDLALHPLLHRAHGVADVHRLCGGAPVHLHVRLHRGQESCARARSCCRCWTSCSRCRCWGFSRSPSPASWRCFPGSLLGVECASIFAIFTAQAWNMTFGFYHSLITIPAELQEAASVYRLNRWQRFTKVELPVVGDRPDVELDDELRRRLVLRRAKRSHLGHEQEHQAARIGVVHGCGGRSGRHARRRLRDPGDDRHHRRPRPAASGGRWSRGPRSSSSSRPRARTTRPRGC